MSTAPRQATTIITVGDRPVALRVQRVTLEAIAGPAAGAKAELAGRQLSVGSDKGCDFTIDDPTVSRLHFRLVTDERGFRVVDRASANGTRLNGVRVRDAYIEDGAIVSVGTSEIVIRIGDDATEIELSEHDYFGHAVGRSIKMRELFATARRAAASQVTILLQGETGTGKDLIARAIHDHGSRKGPFVVFDAGAVTPTLIESALFGHVRGAFTGAEADRPGVFEQAHGGTLFIDEIGELPTDLQPKLLRALESGEIVRVGATQPIPVDVRILAATNRDLREEIAAERFRADLYFRLAVITLEVPPLRDRAEDIPLLAAHFLRHVLDDGRDPSWLLAHIDDAFGALARHAWPGNVRELRNVLERAVALADPTQLAGNGIARLVELRSSIAATIRHRPPLDVARKQFDREYLRDVLEHAAGDVKAAAQAAGVHPKSFERLLRRYDIRRS